MLPAFRKVNPVGDDALHAVENNVDQALAPLLALPFADGRLLTVVLPGGASVATDHLLGRPLTGWLLTDLSADATVWREPGRDTQIVLNSSAAVTAAMWVF